MSVSISGILGQKKGAYHGGNGIGLHKSVVKHLSEIRSIGPAELAEVVDQGRIKQGEFVVHTIQVGSLETVSIFEQASGQRTLTMSLNESFQNSPTKNQPLP